MTQQTAKLMDTTSIPLPCKLIPYIEHDGMRTFTDTFIRGLYERMEEEGTASIVFSDGEINSAEEFLSAMKYGANSLYIVDVYGDVAGVVWANRFKSKTAYIHFCGFQRYWGNGSVEIGRAAMGQILYMVDNTGEYYLDTLLGLIPCTNIPAIKWLKKVGLEEVGKIPSALWSNQEKKSEDGLLLYLTREGLD